MVNEDMAHMKHLMGYKSNETLGLVKGKARLDENKMFTDIWSKTRELMEAEDIESVKAKTGNLEDIKKKAPEATKHVQGSVSKDKGTQAPAAKEGDLDDAVSHAPEAKKHVEGSVSTEKGTKAPAPKNGNWEDVKKKSADATKHVTLKESEEKEDEEEKDYGTNKVTGEKLPKPEPITEEDDVKPEAPSHKDTAANQVTEISDIEGTKPSKTAPWEDHNVKHAAEAKKHIMNMNEGITLGGIRFEPINESMYEGLYEEDMGGEYYIAIAAMDEPGEANAQIVSPNEVSEYLENGWEINGSGNSLEGPYSEEEANQKMDKINKSNSDWRYYSQMDDREGKSNLYIDPLDKFERDGIDTNW